MAAPLVLLHGFAGAPAAWDEVARHVAAEPVRPALLGHDPARVDAELADPPASFDDAVDALAAQLLAAGVSRGAHLCGYSLGARMALGLLRDHPAMFERATLIGVHPGLEDPDARSARAAVDLRWAALAEQGDLERFLGVWEDQPLFATQRRLPAAVRDGQRRWRSRLRPEGLALSLRRAGLARMPSYWDSLAAFTIPVRLVVGEEDVKFRALAARAAQLLPNCRLSVIPACGHNVVLEAPAVVAALLSEE